MKNKSLIIILIITLILVTISCGEKTTGIESDNYGVILDSLCYSTIQEAIDEASDGDTIYLTEGIYADAGDKNLNWNGNEKHLTIKLHQEADYAIIECNGKGSGFIFDRTHQNTSDVIDSITIRNCGNNPENYDSGIYCEDVSVTIRNCIIYDCGWCGIYCDDSAPIIENCVISENLVGIMADNGAIPLVKLNIIENNRLDGLYAKDDSYPSIINNLVVHNKRGIYCLHAQAWMVNNTIADNEVWGINYINSDSSEVINCIIWDNGKGFQTADINIVVSYSCAQDSFASVNPDTSGNIYDPPCFVLPGNYILHQSSLCINAGDSTVVTWDFDLEGNPRIYDENVDMGAYEWKP